MHDFGFGAWVKPSMVHEPSMAVFKVEVERFPSSGLCFGDAAPALRLSQLHGKSLFKPYQRAEVICGSLHSILRLH